MPGYSGTPLTKKLGIKDTSVVQALNAPSGYKSWLVGLPPGATFANRLTPSVDIVHLFVTKRSDLEKHLRSLRDRVQPDCTVWVSWPKQSAKVPTDVTETVIREVCLPLGWVDIKVCAVNETWSGLKLMIRKELRHKG